MLKRNPSDRINFEDFSTHQFLIENKADQQNNALLELTQANEHIRELQNSISEDSSSCNNMINHGQHHQQSVDIHRTSSTAKNESDLIGIHACFYFILFSKPVHAFEHD